MLRNYVFGLSRLSSLGVHVLVSPLLLVVKEKLGLTVTLNCL